MYIYMYVWCFINTVNSIVIVLLLLVLIGNFISSVTSYIVEYPSNIHFHVFGF